MLDNYKLPEWIHTWEEADEWISAHPPPDPDRLCAADKYALMFTCRLFTPYMEAALTDKFNPYKKLLMVLEWKEKVKKHTGETPERFTEEFTDHRRICIKTARWN